MEAKKNTLEGIGGWLVLPALGLTLSPFFMGFQFYNGLLPALMPEVWNAVTDRNAPAYHPLWGPLIIYEVAVSLALLSFTVWLLWLFYTKSRRVPNLFIAWLALDAATQIVDQVLAHQIPALANQPFDPAVIRDLVRTIISCGIWIPYFMKSERVKNTFVEPVAKQAAAADSYAT